MPTVVNRHHFKDTSEIPRPDVGRGTPLGNPYTRQKHGEEALALYRRWLWSRIQERDPKVMRALRAIRADLHLVCSCAPRPCHADVIVRAWEWLRRSEH